MRILSRGLPASIALHIVLLSLAAVTTVVLASTPISSLTVTLRGKQYDVSDVTTVKDLQTQLESKSGVASKQQGRVIFGGKRLDPDTVLTEVGVPTEGAQLNMVPSTSSSGKKKKSKAKAATTASASSAGPASASNPMTDYLKQSGVDTSQLDEMMKSMGGGGAAPSMQDSMKAMTEAMNSPLFKEMMSDPERLEQSRQMILNNPMLKSMMAGMPGMEEVLNDKDAWREAMQAAAELYQNMDSDDLMQAMSGMEGMKDDLMKNMGGMGGMGGAGANLFDGTLDDSAATAALDELDEDE